MIKIDIKQLSQYLNISENSIATQFSRLQKNYLKKGINIIKEGRGTNATYKIININTNIYPSMVESEGKITMLKKMNILKDEKLLVFLGIASSGPQYAYRGTYKNFLSYIGWKINKNNILKLKNYLNELKENNYIIFENDPYIENAFSALLPYYWNSIAEYKIELKLIHYLNNICKKYNKDKWTIMMLKVLIALELIYNKEDYITYRQLNKSTNLSPYYLKNILEILHKENWIYKKVLKENLKNKEIEEINKDKTLSLSQKEEYKNLLEDCWTTLGQEIKINGIIELNNFISLNPLKS